MSGEKHTQFINEFQVQDWFVSVANMRINCHQNLFCEIVVTACNKGNWMAGHRIRSPDKGLGSMPPRPLSSHQPQAIKNGNSPFEWIQKGGHVSAYDRLQLMDKAAYLEFVVEIIRRRNGAKGFEVLSRRWVVERTFGWMTRWRRLVRDYERRIDVSQAMILVAMGANLIRRNAHP